MGFRVQRFVFNPGAAAGMTYEYEYHATTLNPRP